MASRTGVRWCTTKMPGRPTFGREQANPAKRRIADDLAARDRTDPRGPARTGAARAATPRRAARGRRRARPRRVRRDRGRARADRARAARRNPLSASPEARPGCTVLACRGGFGPYSTLRLGHVRASLEAHDERAVLMKKFADASER